MASELETKAKQMAETIHRESQLTGETMAEVFSRYVAAGIKTQSFKTIEVTMGDDSVMMVEWLPPDGYVVMYRREPELTSTDD